MPLALRLPGTVLLPRQIRKLLTSLCWGCWEKGRANPYFVKAHMKKGMSC